MGATIHADVAALAGAGYHVALIDPPWRFASNSAAKPGRNAMRHYPTMSLAQIASIPVGDMLGEDAAVFLWIPPAFLAIGAHLPILEAWRVKPKSIAFTWVKTQASIPWHYKIREDDLHLNTGFTTRKQCEQVLLASRGRSLRVHAGIREVVIAPVQEHSRKPPEIARRILRYVGPSRKAIELFSRETALGFDHLGRDVGKFDGSAGA